MTKNFIVPEFGPMAGVRILTTGSLIAMPHAASMLGDFGAEVICFEREDAPETFRSLPGFIENGDKKIGAGFAQTNRNKLNVSFGIDLSDPTNKEIFTDLVKKSDIYMENMVWIEKFGITEEWLLSVNPRLIIVHVSGFGNKKFGGVPELNNRGSNDAVGQAFSGQLSINGTTEQPEYMNRFANDYITGLTTCIGTLLAYTHFLRTGEGQVVDVSQYESSARILDDLFLTYTETGVSKRPAPMPVQPAGIFMTKDKWVSLAAFGPSQFKKSVEILGLDPEHFTFDCSHSDGMFTEKGREFDAKFREWMKFHTADEVVEKFATRKVPASTVNLAEDCVHNEHFNARGNFVTYVDQTLCKEIKAFGVIPHMSKTPGKVWRGAPRVGQDNYDVLKTILGYSEEKIASFNVSKPYENPD
jgi:crotonobetainyl-CoA:carnitine CoA-transferase CaiB-like acyl-CoA transferase